ncbi:MAG TPA: exodeoxyribonuclease V subunit gamma [Polyangiaceae bacterium]|jgi:exodeoxyribonuclease V gamma subunit|nr:exodeoxyribonuclease V subunit gamma [Polyangiaceae bacterium]
MSPALRLVYSNRAGELLADLAARVRAQQTRDGALTPVRIVVPSGDVEAYVRLGVARAQGIAANLAFARLTQFASETVEAVATARAAEGAHDAASRPPRVADAAAIEAMALRLLLDEGALAHPDLAPVRAYLAGGGDAVDPMDVRRVQLAARVGRLFEEYTYSRADMLAAWSRGASGLRGRDGGDDGPAPRHAETEVWQRRLWMAMFGDLSGEGSGAGAFARAAGILPLHEAVQSLDPRPGDLPRAVHVFGFAHVARGFLDLIERAARATEVVLYAISPCEGFWEDLDANDPALLRLWGRPGREQVRAWNALARFDHDDRFADPLQGDASPTLLHRIQSDVLRREPAPAAAPAPDPRHERDGTLLVLEHASVRRELEAVASEVWRLLEADPTLRFDEIAVVVPAGAEDEYAAQAPSVFREAHDLPLRASATAPYARGGGVVEAVDLLLALPLGKCTRQEVMRLVLHPAILGAMGDADPVRWAAWCDGLGIVHGADRADHEETYIERDVLNWDQGLRRLALGAFMSGDASGDATPFEANGESYVPYEVAGAELPDAAAFGVLVRSVLADARFARDAALPMRRWGALLCRFVETYVTPASPAEEEQLARCLRRLHALGEVDVGPAPVRFRVAYELARRRIEGLPRGASGEGVVLSTLAALRPVPYRVVFACGMGEGQFPSPEAEDPLDLRWARRREGDVTARERDKYAFLELVLQTRDRLVLSYVSREPLTGETLAASSVVEELLHAVHRGYGVAPDRLRRRHPLRRWSPQYFPEVYGGREAQGAALGPIRIPEARAEAQTAALRRSLDASGERLTGEAILDRAGDPLWRALADHLGLVHLPPAPPFAQAAHRRLAVPVSALVKFLEFPLQGWARFRVGLDERDDDDPMQREDEPFETDARREVIFLREVLLDAAARGCALEAAYDDAVRGRELRGAGPSGLFARGERDPHLKTLRVWCDEIAEHGELPGALEIHRFGRAGEHADARRVYDAVGLDVDLVDGGVARLLRVEIGGRTLPMGEGAATSITLHRRPKESWDDPWVGAELDRAALRAFFDHAMLAASGLGEGQAHASMVVVRTPAEAYTTRVDFAPLARDEALGWLRGLVREILQGPHAYFLPCEAVFAHARRDPEAPFGPDIEDARRILAKSDGPLALRSAYGPVPRPQTYPAPAEAQARAMAEARFGLFFRTKVDGGAAPQKGAR